MSYLQPEKHANKRRVRGIAETTIIHNSNGETWIFSRSINLNVEEKHEIIYYCGLLKVIIPFCSRVLSSLPVVKDAEERYNFDSRTAKQQLKQN